MSLDRKNKKLLQTLRPALDASFDPICIVNHRNEIIYCNLMMKGFLGLRGRDVGAGKVFCDLLKLNACGSSCQILQMLKTGEPMRLDESPAVKGTDKLRVTLKAVPLTSSLESSGSSWTQALGAIITVRDTTGEILLQAKYHKVMQLLEDKNAQIESLEQKIQALRLSLRKGRDEAA